mgnify:CR=1 FL=1
MRQPTPPVERMDSLVAYGIARLETRLGPTDVTIAGGSDGPVILLLSGLVGGAWSWVDQLTAFGPGFRVLVPELVGATQRETPPASLTTDDEAGWVSNVLDGVAAPSASLVGLWRGARIAIDFAVAAPARVDRIALLSPVDVLAPSRVLPAIPHPPWRRCVSALPPIAKRDLRRVSAPALVLIGERDGPRPPAANLARRWQALPNLIAFGVVPEAGRALHRDQPETVNALLADFLLRGEDWQPEAERPSRRPVEVRRGRAF